jgi:hypothetical protein
LGVVTEVGVAPTQRPTISANWLAGVIEELGDGMIVVGVVAS